MINVKKESFVFTKQNYEKCLYQFVKKGTVSLYTIDDYGKPLHYFEEGKDYIVDYEKGEVKRTENSTIPDFSNHVFYGQNPFNQEGISPEKWSNKPYTVYCDYASNENSEIINCSEKINLFPKLFEKIGKGENIKITVFGDSISTGAEATKGNAYFELLGRYIEKQYGVKVEINNQSVCGDDTVAAIKRIKDVDLKCDLAIIAFGMNDQNYNQNEKIPFVPPKWYEYNISHFVDLFKSNGAEVMLVSPHLPNPKWIYTSGWLEDYVCVLKHISEKQNVVFANVYDTFKFVYMKGKSYESILNNNINHPNDFGHELYFRTLKRFF